jgi:tetratricopeptide (TPR) repeat protein
LKSTGLEAPFVGRDRELRLMKELFHASADERKAHLVSVTGIAGIGKSRIGWEFYKYFDGLAGVVWWHRGRCLAYGEGVTYWALADMVRMRCRIAEDEDESTGTDKLRATLAEHILDDEERAFVEPRVLQLLGWGGTEQGEKQQLFAAWRLFFERMADTEPVVMVFEDLQWADESLLDFIEYLLEWSRNQPIFVVTLARPELTEKRTTWGARQRAFTSIYLEPLPPVAMEALLAGLVPGMPPELVQEILARAEGIPLYAVETVRMLLDRGLIAEDGASYRVVGEIGALDVPETLQALIAARLDGLADGERALVQDAAVLGKTFGSTLLARVAGRPEDEVEGLLTSLVRKEVLSLQADPRSPEHGQYGFLQDLVRRVAYETLARRDRKARHLAAADQIAAALGEEDVPEVVASHLVAALEASPDADDAEAIRQRAGHTYVLAGERAERLAAAGESARFYEQAAELSVDAATKAELIDRAGRMAWVAGRVDDARSLLVAARSAYDELGDEVATVFVDSKLAEIDFNDGRVPEAVDRMGPAVEAIERVGTPADIAATVAQFGRFLVFARDYEGAGAQLERALALAEELHLPETLAQALNSKSVLTLFQGRPHESRLLVRGALAVALEHDLHDPALRAYNNVVAAEWYAMRWREGLEIVNEALEYARRTGERTWEVSFVTGSTGGLDFLGRWDEALERGAAVDPYATTEFARGLLLWLALIHMRRGDLAAARELVDRHSDIGRSGNPEFSAAYAAVEACVCAAEGKYEEAHRAALRALPVGVADSAWWLSFTAADAALLLPDDAHLREVYERIDDAVRGKRMRAVEAQLGRVRARLSPEDAVTELEGAERIFRELEAVFFTAVVQTERAELLIAAGQADEARDLLAEARETFAGLRAEPWIARADAAFERSPAVA